jgi:hypothetical protein
MRNNDIIMSRMVDSMPTSLPDPPFLRQVCHPMSFVRNALNCVCFLGNDEYRLQACAHVLMQKPEQVVDVEVRCSGGGVWLTEHTIVRHKPNMHMNVFTCCSHGSSQERLPTCKGMQSMTPSPHRKS